MNRRGKKNDKNVRIRMEKGKTERKSKKYIQANDDYILK